jgi:long-subunit acyl-CoA synthetase (AMP-forming)
MSIPPDPSGTLVALLRQRAASHGGRVALREKRRGVWRSATWNELAGGEHAIFACGVDDAAIDRARTRVAELSLFAEDEALILAPATWPDHAREIVAQWLVAGFALAIPETVDSVAGDLREVRPTYLFGPAHTFHAIHAETEARLPAPRTWRRRLIDRALRSTGPLGTWLVSAPLRRALGWSRVRVAVSLDVALAREPSDFFASIGVPVIGPGVIADATAAIAEPLATAQVVPSPPSRAHAPLIEGRQP